jgi:hypothetical protein
LSPFADGFWAIIDEFAAIAEKGCGAVERRALALIPE